MVSPEELILPPPKTHSRRPPQLDAIIEWSVSLGFHQKKGNNHELFSIGNKQSELLSRKLKTWNAETSYPWKVGIFDIGMEVKVGGDVQSTRFWRFLLLLGIGSLLFWNWREEVQLRWEAAVAERHETIAKPLSFYFRLSYRETAAELAWWCFSFSVPWWVGLQIGPVNPIPNQPKSNSRFESLRWSRCHV